MTHIFFDLDGTLTDAKEGIIACFRFALSGLGIDIDPETKLETFIGPPMRDVFRELCETESQIEKAVVLYRERFSTLGMFENKVYDGIPECLDRLVEKSDSIHVVTSKPTVYSERIIEHFHLKQYFEVVYGSDLDGARSDKTELLGYVLKKEEIHPEDSVMIGDRKFDIVGAKNHGIRSIGVLWGYGTASELKRAGADALTKHPIEIYDKIFT